LDQAENVFLAMCVLRLRLRRDRFAKSFASRTINGVFVVDHTAIGARYVIELTAELHKPFDQFGKVANPSDAAFDLGQAHERLIDKGTAW